jgi:type I restriction enzyme S subunit
MRLSFEEIFADESGGNIKTPQSEYRAAGAFPVIDQGKALIGGYVDDTARVCGGGRPAIVFGDHTRCIKFIDFPFCMGADGVKVLRPKLDADLKYLYYYLRTLKLPEAGYDRHYKYLKRTEVLLPSLPEQRRIAAILDQADALRAKRREALAQLDKLTQAIFVEMFGDLESNVNGLPVKNLEDLCVRVTDGTHQSPKWEPDGIPFLFISNILNGEISYSTEKFISRETYHELTRRCAIDAGDVLFTTVGSYGNTAVVSGEREFCFQRHIAHIKPNAEKLDSSFCAAMLESPSVRRQIDKVARGVAQKTINLADLKALRVFSPPIEKQKSFTTKQGLVKSIKAIQAQSLREFDDLFTSLQHRAFRGEL